MVRANVAIIDIKPHPDRDVKDGVTKKTVRFAIVWLDQGWNFEHVIVDGSQLFDEQIDKLKAYGGITILVREIVGDEPTLEWKNEVVQMALREAGNTISWDRSGRPPQST